MTNGRQPVLTGVIQSDEKDPKKRKVLGRIALWKFESRKGEGESPLFQLSEVG